MPTLILHAKDDSVASFENQTCRSRFPQCTFVAFEDGGHMMAGHGRIDDALNLFLSD